MPSREPGGGPVRRVLTVVRGASDVSDEETQLHGTNVALDEPDRASRILELRS